MQPLDPLAGSRICLYMSNLNLALASPKRAGARSTAMSHLKHAHAQHAYIMRWTLLKPELFFCRCGPAHQSKTLCAESKRCWQLHAQLDC